MPLQLPLALLAFRSLLLATGRGGHERRLDGHDDGERRADAHKLNGRTESGSTSSKSAASISSEPLAPLPLVRFYRVKRGADELDEVKCSCYQLPPTLQAW
jgi:hypothetical protein